jgi:hypothetical protein
LLWAWRSRTGLCSDLAYNKTNRQSLNRDTMISYLGIETFG